MHFLFLNVVYFSLKVNAPLDFFCLLIIGNHLHHAHSVPHFHRVHWIFTHLNVIWIGFMWKTHVVHTPALLSVSSSLDFGCNDALPSLQFAANGWQQGRLQAYQLSVLFDLSKQRRPGPCSSARVPFLCFSSLQHTDGGRLLCRAGLKKQTWYVSLFTCHNHLSCYIMPLQFSFVAHWLISKGFCLPLGSHSLQLKLQVKTRVELQIENC